jgi:hypothetical protein
LRFRGQPRDSLSAFPLHSSPSNLYLSSALHRRKGPEGDKDETSAAVNGLATRTRAQAPETHKAGGIGGVVTPPPLRRTPAFLGCCLRTQGATE